MQQNVLQHAPPNGAEHLLGEAVRRLLRHPDGALALILHLSRLPPPGARPHHRRIARALMLDAAERHDGQVFAPRNGDLVLLCRVTPEASPGSAIDNLPATLARLLQVDAANPQRLVSLYPLASDAVPLGRYVAARAEEASTAIPQVAPSPATVPGKPASPAAVAAIVVGGARVTELLRRQVAVLLPSRTAAASGRGGNAITPTGLPAGLQPLHRAIALSLSAIEARLGGSGHPPDAAGGLAGDPFLWHYVAGQLDPLVLETLLGALGSGGPLDAAATPAGASLPLSVALTLPAIMSDLFATWVQGCRARRAKPLIEVAMAEACTDATGFEAARTLVRNAGLPLALGGVSYLTLLLSQPAELGADLLRLDWSPRLLGLGTTDAAAVAAAIGRQGVDRTLLARADTEAALQWGRSLGIRRFQGHHVDAMLGASRIIGCDFATGCTLSQCIERAGASEPRARRLCRDTGLLDAGAQDFALDVGAEVA